MTVLPSPLPPETLALIREMQAREPHYVKVKDDGFQETDGTIIPEITGVIEAVVFFYQCYDRGIMNRIAFEEVKGDPPENYEIRATVRIKTASGIRYEVTLSKSSVKKHLVPYIFNLGLQPVDGVITKLGVRKVEWQSFKFNVVTFQLLGPAETEMPQEEKNLVA